MSRKLHIGNLPSSATEEDLLAKFGQFGVVKSAQVIRDERTGKSCGYGHVEMASYEEAQTVVNRFHFSQYEDRVISVRFVRKRFIS